MYQRARKTHTPIGEQHTYIMQENEHDMTNTYMYVHKVMNMMYMYIQCTILINFLQSVGYKGMEVSIHMCACYDHMHVHARDITQRLQKITRPIT